ncbi:MAG TPA: chemotaxis protein CheW [Oscillospiraceae bacterium]|nr:chemotaxis protein CheW [Oscillospiraceae bacterium]
MAAENFSESNNFFNEGGEVLLFSIDNKIYGIEIEYVTEIIGVQQITVVPKVPSYIKGVINIRGKVIPVMSVRNRFGIEERDFDERTCIIVVNFNGVAVGIIVDRVKEVFNARPKQISNTPDFKNVNKNRFIRYIINANDEVKLLLDIKTLITE